MPEIIHWPDGSTEPLTPEIAAALVAIVRVFGPGCRCEGSRPAAAPRSKQDHKQVYWQRDRDRKKSTPHRT